MVVSGCSGSKAVSARYELFPARLASLFTLYRDSGPMLTVLVHPWTSAEAKSCCQCRSAA